MDAGRVGVGALWNASPATANAMPKKCLFVASHTNNCDKLTDAAKHPNGLFIAQPPNCTTPDIRADRPNDAEAHKAWSDLIDSKYKSKMVMADPAFTSLQVSVVGTMAKEHGWPFYEKLRANDVMIVQGNQQVADMLKRGERLIAIGALDS